MRAGTTHSPESRAKMSATRAGRKASEETIKRLVEVNKGNKYRLGQKHSAETRAKMSESHKGKIKTPEHLANLAKSQRQRQILNPSKMPAEALEAARRANIGNKHAAGQAWSEERRRQNGNRFRKMWLDGKFDHKHPCWGKAGVHAGIKMRCLNSEGVFAQDCDEAGISWQYEPRRFKLSWCSYRPDFYLPEFDIWIEVKGYPKMPGNWPRKIETFRRETGKTLVVVYMRELSSLKYEKGESDV